MTKHNVPDLIWQFSVLGTGIDDTAQAVWIWKRLEQEMQPEVKNAVERACVHWDACDESLQEAIGPFFGLGEPHNERWPVLHAIKADYEVALSLVIQLCDEEEAK